MNCMPAHLWPSLPQPAPKPKPAPKPAAAPAAAAGASALARTLIDPPPKRPDGRQQKGGRAPLPALLGQHASSACCCCLRAATLPSCVRSRTPPHLLSSPTLSTLPLYAAKKLPQAAQIKQQPHQLVPEATAAAAAAAGVQQFAFDQPSPDDVVLAAQQKKGPVATLRPYNPLQQQAQQQRQAQQGAAGAALTDGMQGLSVGGGSAAEPANAGPQQQQQQKQQQQQQARRRPLSEYRPEPELAAECERAAAAEAGAGGKPRLHLVVLGHVDAGKSTLMGRMLYELGLISDKTVHKTQVGLPFLCECCLREQRLAGVDGSALGAWGVGEFVCSQGRCGSSNPLDEPFSTKGRRVPVLSPACVPAPCSARRRPRAKAPLPGPGCWTSGPRSAPGV